MVPDPTTGVAGYAVNLLVGGFALYVAARYAVYRDEFRYNGFDHALVTALLGAVAWALLAWVPLVGAVLALAGWAAVVHARYPGGWARTATLGAAAWAAAVVVLAALELVGIGAPTAAGVPGA